MNTKCARNDRKVLSFALGVLLTLTLGILYGKIREIKSTTISNDYSEKLFKEWMRDNFGNLTKRRIEWWKIVLENEEKKRVSRVPDIIGIGVRKCGTGMLQGFISMHPLVRRNISEVHFYDKKRQLGLEYYKSQLPPATNEELIMEKTPAYFTTPPYDLPEIIKQDSPNVKTILILCDPVKRAFSDYVMRTLRGSKKAASKTFEEYLEYYLPLVKNIFKGLSMDDSDSKLEYVLKSLKRDRCSFSFGHGIYAYFIRRWLKVFLPDQIMIIDGEDFLSDPGRVIEELQEYLGIPILLKKQDFVMHPRTGLFCLRQWWMESYDFFADFMGSTATIDRDWRCSTEAKGYTRSLNARYHLSNNTHAKLKAFFSPYNEILYKMLKIRFKW